MFPFDHAALPQLTTRKALLGVDFQNDFIAHDGALPVQEPRGFVDRVVKLAKAFREVGDVVWVQSQYDKPRPADAEQIIATDNAPPRARPSSRIRIPLDTDEEAGPPDPEAFLSHQEPECVRPTTTGCNIAVAIEETSQKADLKLTKSHYSAFQSTQLLRILRAKMVMEVFICGSLMNVGVYATALDAAGHGMSITIVHDCSGYRSDARQARAINNLIEITGCEIASFEEVMETIGSKPQPQPRFQSQPKVKAQPVAGSKEKHPPKRLESTGKGSTETEGRESITPEIVKDMIGLRLASGSPSPAKRTQPQGKAPLTSSAERLDSTSEHSSEAEEAYGTNPLTTEEPTRSADIEGSGIDKDEKAPSSPKDLENHEGQSKDESTTQSAANPTPEPPPNQKLAMDSEKAETRAEDRTFSQKGLCEGDTDVIENILPAPVAEGIFDQLREEVQWQRMSHQGGEVPRLVAVQGQVADDGSIPIYRHPSDESPPLLPFSPNVLAIKAETEKHLGHALNHVLIQFYRDGSDYISEHSDKTLDIVQGSYIANVSLGAERTMVFRTKRLDKDPSRTEPVPVESKRQIQRAKLPHNSLCRFGLKSNMKWLHAIRQDKRAEREKSATELAYDGGRISLTFRQIGTFLNREETLIWGQGATGKTQEAASGVINGQTPEAVKMLKAFGTENHAAEFDWNVNYGNGFDVLHMSNAPRFFSSSDDVVNGRILMMLSEFGVHYAKASIAAAGSSKLDPSASALIEQPDRSHVRFVDKDKSTIQGDIAIMMYLDARYGAGKPGVTPRTPPQLAVQLTRFQQAIELFDKWHRLPNDGDAGKRNLKLLTRELAVWDDYAREAEGLFIAGPKLSLPDFAVWPVLHAMIEEAGPDTLDGCESLKKYYQAIEERPSAMKLTGNETQAEPLDRSF